jgi:hypothetical protein
MIPCCDSLSRRERVGVRGAQLLPTCILPHQGLTGKVLDHSRPCPWRGKVRMVGRGAFTPTPPSPIEGEGIY